MIIASICLLQMIVSLLLDSRYDVGPLENLFLDAVVSVIIIGSYRSVAIHMVEGLFLAGMLILLALSGWQSTGSSTMAGTGAKPLSGSP